MSCNRWVLGEFRRAPRVQANAGTVCLQHIHHMAIVASCSCAKPSTMRRTHSSGTRCCVHGDSSTPSRQLPLCNAESAAGAQEKDAAAGARTFLLHHAGSRRPDAWGMN